MASVSSSRGEKPDNQQQRQSSSAANRKLPLVPQSTWDHVHRHIYEARHFEARLIGRLSEISALRVDVIAQLMASTVVLLLLVPGIAPIMSAAILIGYPLATTYLYPEERASRDSLLIYWACYALLSFFDRHLEVIPGYYVLKLALLALLFLEPWRLVDVLQQSTSATSLNKKSMFDKSELEALTKNNKPSPRPEKPEEERAHSVANSKATESTQQKMAEPSTAINQRSTRSVTASKPASNAQSAISVGLEKKPLTKKWLTVGNKYKAVPLDLHKWKKAASKQTSDTDTRLSTAMSTDPLPAVSPDSSSRSPGSSRRLTAKSAMHSLSGIIVSPCDSQHDLTMCPTPKSSRLEKSEQQMKESAPYVPTYQEPPLPDGLVSSKQSTSTTEPTPDTTLTNTAQSISSDSARPTTSAVDLAGQQLCQDVNPMTVDASYHLDPNVSVDKSSTTDGMEISPAHQLAFNAPFDFDHVTYHMKIKNTSKHSIAFMIKGNAVPRVTAHPPNGILQADETMLIGVTVKKFDWNPSDFNKDRICFEYVELKDELKDVKEFSHSLFKNSDLKRTRNIYVTYNV